MVTTEQVRVVLRGNPVAVTPKLLPTSSYDEAMEAVFNPPSPYSDIPEHILRRLTLPAAAPQKALEAHARGTQRLVHTPHTVNRFFWLTLLAYSHHLPLTLSPDMIWLLIAQGFAQHIQANAEALRSRFVAHQGQRPIVVVRNEFLRGFAGNDWEGVFAEFSAQIRGIVGDDRHALIVQDFSTTGIVEQAAVEVTLMAALQSYLAYTLVTRCGIPEFHLEGTVEDWEKLRAATERLQSYDLDWWIPALLPVLDQFVAAANGNENPDFWGSFFKLAGGSGGPWITGQIARFLPYLVDRSQKVYRNPFLDSDLEPAIGIGILSSRIPNGLATAPFLWAHHAETLPMEFVAGFVGATQHPSTYALRPEIAWCVRYA